MAATDAGEKPSQYLTMRLGPDEYGIALAAVREIVPIQSLTRVPGTPAWVRGVCNLRGTVLPVVDLAVRFGFGQVEAGKRTCLLVLELPYGKQTLTVAAVAESVSNVVEVVSAQIEPPPAVGLRMEVEYVRGLVRAGERFIVLLDVSRIFACDELVELEETAPQAASAPAPAAPAALSPSDPLPPAEDGGVSFF